MSAMDSVSHRLDATRGRHCKRASLPPVAVEIYQGVIGVVGGAGHVAAVTMEPLGPDCGP